MGGDLSQAPAGKPPAFLVYAMRDPDGPNLDRIQIIKGWLDKDGKVAGTHLRRGSIWRSQDRCEWPLQNSCGQHGGYTERDLQQYHRRDNAVGVLEGSGVRCSQRAFYYIRVIQIPSPRWTAYDQKRFGIKMPDYVPMTVTDRAYTSPIWYSPAK